MRKYESAHDWVNTSEAYSLTAFAGSDAIVVPYINLNLMPANSVNGVQTVVDYSYYLLSGVTDIWINNKHDGWPEETPACITEYIGIGGYLDSKFVEARIQCKEAILFLPDKALFKTHPLDLFVPHDTPYFRRNLDVARVEEFFKQENLPAAILAELGGTIDRIYP